MSKLKIKRFMAFLIDYVFLVLFITMLANLEFLNPKFDLYYETYEKYSQLESSITLENVFDVVGSNEFKGVVYDLDRYGLNISILSLACYLLYFVGFQKWNKNQTIGKRLMNIKVVSNENDKSISWFRYILRCLVLYNLIFDILIIISLFIFGANKYMFVKLAISFVGYIVYYVNVGMVLFKKDGRGLHDIIAGSKVVEVN